MALGLVPKRGVQGGQDRCMPYLAIMKCRITHPFHLSSNTCTSLHHARSKPDLDGGGGGGGGGGDHCPFGFDSVRRSCMCFESLGKCS